MKVHHCVLTITLLLAIASTGCRMSVPVHVWQSAQLKSTVGKRVAVSRVAGPEPFSEMIGQQLLATAPSDTGRDSLFVDAETLQQASPIRLVSASEETFSDVALAAVARRQGFDFMLHGRVVEFEPEGGGDPNGENQSQLSGDPKAQRRASPERPAKLALSWRLTALNGSEAPQGSPVVVDLKSAVERYPDLALHVDPAMLLIDAAARDTHRLLAPSIVATRATLAIPYFMPGSRKVREGNVQALAGNWAEARRLWREAADRHPWQNAALINLARAHVAAQEFSEARHVARQAVRRFPSPLARETLIWVELKQREYHRAFNLPDPPEGWFVTRDQRETTVAEHDAATQVPEIATKKR